MLVNTIDFKIRIRELEVQLFQRDLVEVNGWIDGLESLSRELGALLSIEKQHLRDDKIRYDLLALRRINTLAMASFCKYQQIIKNEMEYGRDGYCKKWARSHENQREDHKKHLKVFDDFKMNFFNRIIK